ncbi:MAG: fasciclin domain-containing protein [Gemmatimonadota bacterium]|nr:fasciclin domain-containing protein [Gemmatimonadota bacterium]
MEYLRERTHAEGTPSTPVLVVITAVVGLILFLTLASPLRGQEMAEKDVAVGSDLISTLDDEGLTVFADLVEAADLADDLEGEDALTLFVPHNAAFARVPEDVVKGSDHARAAVLHLTTTGTTGVLSVLDGSEHAMSLRPYGPVGGLTVELGEDGRISVRDTDQRANVIGEALMVDEHMLYVIDEVLLPDTRDGAR